MPPQRLKRPIDPSPFRPVGISLQGIVRGREVHTTVSNKAAACPLDRVNRQFHAPRPNALWLSDFSYVATWQGFVHVVFVIDAYARRIVGRHGSRTAHAACAGVGPGRPPSPPGRRPDSPQRLRRGRRIQAVVATAWSEGSCDGWAATFRSGFTGEVSLTWPTGCSPA